MIKATHMVPTVKISPCNCRHKSVSYTHLVAILGKDENRGKTAYFASINSAEFKRKVVPGDILTLETEIIKVKGPIGVGKALSLIHILETIFMKSKQLILPLL